jgi:heme/copper-type cytochrome/quinol oxidase subunit 1
MRLTKIGLAMGAALLFSAPLWAHHAFTAEFDGNKPVKLHGTVSKMEWINP